MSAYGHPMEREFSVQSLSSRGGSEVGSHHQYESGFYMTSFAATVFIAGLATLGVIMITLLIALGVMLQSCESRHSGVVEGLEARYRDDYCRIFLLNAEVNKLEAEGYSSVCNDYIRSEGRYEKEMNISLRLAEDYFSNIRPSDDKLGVVLIDIDDIFPLLQLSSLLNQRHIPLLRLYKKLQASGRPLMLLSRKSEEHRNSTTNYLTSAGFVGWSSLIMRSDDEIRMDDYEYFLKRRAMIEEEGFKILGIISSQMDALTGPNIGRRVFKLPKPYFSQYRQNESKI